MPYVVESTSNVLLEHPIRMTKNTVGSLQFGLNQLISFKDDQIAVENKTSTRAAKSTTTPSLLQFTKTRTSSFQKAIRADSGASKNPKTVGLLSSQFLNHF